MGSEARRWQGLMLPRLVFCCTLMLIKGDQACRSGLELVSAFCHRRLDAHEGLGGARETFDPLISPNDLSLCKLARRRASTCDQTFSSYIVCTFRHLLFTRQVIMSEASSERKELKASWKTEVEVPLLTLDDVKKHNTKNDLWMVIHGGGKQPQFELQLLAILTEDLSVQCHRICSRPPWWAGYPDGSRWNGCYKCL